MRRSWLWIIFILTAVAVMYVWRLSAGGKINCFCHDGQETVTRCQSDGADTCQIKQ